MNRPQPQYRFPRPGPALRGIMLGLFAIWLFFALGLNWANLPPASFSLLTGNTEAIFQGQVWRLFTAPLLHQPQGDFTHILFALLGLYFLGVPLEEKLGAKKFLRFFFLTGTLAYLIQAALLFVLPGTWGAALAPPYYFGSMPIVSAIAVAWALSFWDQKVLLFMALPLSAPLLLAFIVGIALLGLIAGTLPPSGHLAGFAGMALGFFLAPIHPSPTRRLYLKWKLGSLQKKAARNLEKNRGRRGGFSVIEGGRSGSGNSPKKSENGRTLH